MSAEPKLGYEYRHDGNYLCRVVCQKCTEAFDVHAMANSQRICPACEQVDRWIQESEHDAN